MTKPIFLSIVLLLLTAGAAHGEIYKYVDENGVITYSSFKPSRGGYSVVRLKCRNCGWKTQADWSTVPLNLEAYTREILDACDRFGLDEAFVRAIIHAESAFRHQAISDMGAQGLMQLMPATARQYGVNRPFDPQENINGGTAYLSFLLELFNQDVRLAAAAYNAGENAVRKHGGIPPYQETRDFVSRVETLMKRYAKVLRKPS